MDGRFPLTLLLLAMWGGTCYAAPVLIGLPAGRSVTAPHHRHTDTGYTFYCTGDCDRDVVTDSRPGLVLMGGGTDVDDAFRWAVDQSDDGDFLVLRATGTDAYDDYIYDLGRSNSVATLVITSRQGAAHPFVVDRIQHAEAIFFAGGDQATYLSLWTGTPLEESVQDRVASVPIGGTSAGLAILGGFVYTAENNTVYSREALENPYDKRVTLGKSFLSFSSLQNIVTDTHFVTRDRMGRLMTFVARLLQDKWTSVARGLGVDEHTAICVDESGYGKVYGDGTAYFLHADQPPQQCLPQKPLTFEDVAVYRVDRTSSFDFHTFTGHSGLSYTLSASRGDLSSSRGDIYQRDGREFKVIHYARTRQCSPQDLALKDGLQVSP